MILVDSVTRLRHNIETLVITGSHGAVYAACVAATCGATAVIFNDAGGGRDDAGYAGLAWLDGLEIAAATVGHDTARIGDAVDTLRRGVITHVNQTATALGCTVGKTAADAARLLEAARPRHHAVPALREARYLVRVGPPEVWTLDSVSLVGASDAGHIVVTGSHGGLLGGHAGEALHTDALAAVYNDAGMGIDAAGIGRLAALDERGIVAVTVSSHSARIGDGMSTYRDGVISAVNNTSRHIGVAVGMHVPEFCDAVAAAAPRASATADAMEYPRG